MHAHARLLQASRGRTTAKDAQSKRHAGTRSYFVLLSVAKNAEWTSLHLTPPGRLGRLQSQQPRLRWHGAVPSPLPSRNEDRDGVRDVHSRPCNILLAGSDIYI
jgi:hypothetical protein